LDRPQSVITTLLVARLWLPVRRANPRKRAKRMMISERIGLDIGDASSVAAGFKYFAMSRSLIVKGDGLPCIL
jgi:hypothetical protein